MTQGEFELITLANKPPALRIEHKRIPVEKIALDQGNPRIKYLKELHPNDTLDALLFRDEDTKWLKKDIGENGLIDPIYARVRSADHTSYVVIEGNRRTAVIKALHQEQPDDPKFAFVSARILPEQTTDEQEAMLMASFHVAGKVKWDAHEKAGHIYHMVNVLSIPESELAIILHQGIPSIKRAVQSFEMLESFKKIDGGKYAARAGGKWSFFSEYLKIKSFREMDEKGPEFSEKFMRWVGDERLPRAEDVRLLKDIIEKPTAMKVFEEYADPKLAFKHASQEADKTNPGRKSQFFKQVKLMINACNKSTFADLQDATTNEATRELLVEGYSTLTTFMERANIHRPGPRRVA
jgi:ParB/Sulfiredoxin domain